MNLATTASELVRGPARPPAPALFAREASSLEELQAALAAHLAAGRASIRTWFEAGGSAEVVHKELADLVDEVVIAALSWADRRFGSANRTTGERLAVVAVGGYGRAELAPFSDIDILFLHPYKPAPYVEQMTEFLMHRLWDLGFKVGNALRTVPECIKLAKEDLSVKTNLLEARFLWGERELFEELVRAYDREIRQGQGPEFIEAKLAERDERHRRTGDSRYLLEPNVKEGKGGLRDLQTLVWIGRFLYGAKDPAELVKVGVLTPRALATFRRSRRFLWTVRCHLHWLAGRAEERLTFERQPEIARRMGFRDRGRMRAVERFMKRYYLVAKEVGALTRIVCAALEDQHQRRPRFRLPRFGFGRRKINGFWIQGARVDLAEPDLFERRPVAMLELFHLAQERELDIHPKALTALAQNLKRVDAALRADPTANRLFLEILLSRKDPALALARMNEAGLLGRFVPEFGRIVAQMQHDLYHVYTVDEHTIRAIGVLSQIERGELAHELPLATAIVPTLVSRTELYLATFCHDLGKGRGGDHSRIGAELARGLCRRLGVSEAATETVAWLVRHHLLMSDTAFKRDLDEPKTIADFVSVVQSPERLKLLLVLTVADIRAVGPQVWNGWKGQLLRDLYNAAAELMATGELGRPTARAEAARQRLAHALANLPEPWSADEIARYAERHDPRYWVSFSHEELLRHAHLVRAADRADAKLTIDFRVDTFRSRTEVIIYTPDHPGLFLEIAGALALSRASIVDARIFTTSDGMAFDVLGFQDAETARAIDEPERLERIRRNIERALADPRWLERELARRAPSPRLRLFEVEPRVLVDNAASRTLSVIEVNGRDRPGLLYDLAKALKDLGIVIQSAHIATYGERVVDVFYVKDVFGLKVTAKSKLARVEKRLLEVLAGTPETSGVGP
ncbi:MAG: [protein-PII] uridylyltransferase [Geminicoccaceae bacterium]|nr:[protein-PII] uridylyltransferase [Geminicoccaceae bacterium]MDW8125668.1 [protein-PII] uridylyltransferase [Geminicoccaceae bacterium]